MKIAVIGAGNVGSALGKLFGKLQIVIKHGYLWLICPWRGQAVSSIRAA